MNDMTVALDRATSKILAPSPVVYFISAAGKPRHPVKIGLSRSGACVANRIGHLQTSYPYDLEFLFICEGGRDAERGFHETFAHLRMRGEWFKREQSMLDFFRGAYDLQPNWRRLADPLIYVG